jgi:erythronate-4-phosphate dehydrogenase
MKIVADMHIPALADYFSHQGELVTKPGRAITAADVKEADILIVRSITRVNADLLAGSRVKFVGSVTAGDDHVDKAWLDAHQINYAFAAGFNAPPVADYVVSVVATMQRKRYLSPKSFKAAVIGVGHVGKLVAERLKLLGAEVILCDPLRAEAESDFASTPLEQITDCDFISLHVPLTKDTAYPTYHFIDDNFLSRQTAGCILVNASRGAVMSNEALLKAGAHLHWCFDVWEHEPAIDKLILSRADIATPHIAGYSVQSKLRGIKMIYEALVQHGLIENSAIPLAQPTQTLSFAGEQHHWQDVVLGVFNPLIMTAMMRTTLLSAENIGPLFDEMRAKFNYRHEFSGTYIKELSITNDERQLLIDLGFQFCC